MGEKSIGVLGRNLQSDFFCRICFEEELQHSHKLEAPCGCSGTSKFAHRECVQKWCYEKGNTTCEICLQEFRPGYTGVSTPAPVSEINQTIEEVIVREFSSLNRDQENLENAREDQEDGTLSELLAQFPNSSYDHTPSRWKSVVMIFIVLILVKHIFVVLTGGWRFLSGVLHLMVIVVRTCGCTMPMYLIFWILILIQKYRHSHQELHRLTRYNEDHEDESQLHIRVDH